MYPFTGDIAIGVGDIDNGDMDTGDICAGDCDVIGDIDSISGVTSLLLNPFTGDITIGVGDIDSGDTGDIGAGDRDVLGDMLELTLGDVGFDLLAGVLGGGIVTTSTGVSGTEKF